MTKPQPGAPVAETLAATYAGIPGSVPLGATIGRMVSPAPRVAAVGEDHPVTLPPISLAFVQETIDSVTLPVAVGADEVASLAAGGAPSVAAAHSGADLQVTGLLGEGGMGTVYLARQRALARDVAVKVARPSVTAPMMNASLVTEGMLTGSLEHPNIIPIHALGRDATGRVVLVMKRVEGVVWSELLADDAHPAWSREALADEDHATMHLRILMQVANALEYAHSLGVVHRDVKPANVMLGSFGEVYLLDWGLAVRVGRANGAPRLAGTPGFMAPEMVMGNPADADAQTDVYLLGATLHNVLTGTYRHEGADLASTLALVLGSEPVSYGASVPSELAVLCNAATSRDKAGRPASAAAFRQAVAAYLRHGSSVAVARSADESLARLHELFAAGTPLSALQIAQRLAECRFGYLEALRAWSGNEPARRGLDACLALMVAREIEQRNPAVARALLAEMATPNEALRHRIDGLERDLQEAREREARSAAAARQMDASVSWGPRVVMLMIFLGGVVYATVVTTVQEMETGIAAPIRDVIKADLVQLLAVAVGVATSARQLLGTVYNRRVIGVLLVGTLTVTVVDAVAWSRGISSRTANLFDAIMMAACFTVAAQSVEPGWWRIVGVWIAAAVLSAKVPVLSTAAASIATVLTVLIGILVARASAARDRQKPA